MRTDDRDRRGRTDRDGRERCFRRCFRRCDRNFRCLDRCLERCSRRGRTDGRFRTFSGYRYWGDESDFS
ncbi:MAG TPA: hypothetical protein VK464_29145 [Symbiobacteriaceae bacterium]|jgi:hypothetical protein|nr:hypothetical protein [Symbiobacteriaceae bacterium]